MSLTEKPRPAHQELGRPSERRTSPERQGAPFEPQHRTAATAANAGPTERSGWLARAHERMGAYVASLPPEMKNTPVEAWTRAMFRPDLYTLPEEAGRGREPEAAVQCKPEEPAAVPRPAPGPAGAGAAGALAPAEGRENGGFAQAGDVSAVVDAVAQALAQEDPVAGVGSYPKVWQILGPLPMSELVPVLAALHERGEADLLYANQGALPEALKVRLVAAEKTLEIEALPPGQTMPGLLGPLAQAVEALPAAEDKIAVYRYLFAKRQHWMDLERLLEGATAMHNADVNVRGQMLPEVVMGALGPASQPIEPGPWAKPPEQPGSLYVGNEIHKAIGDEYRAAHSTENVYTNQRQVASILKDAPEQGYSVNPGALAADELRRMPDIVNLTRLYLYEIKPEAYAAEGKTKLALYLGIFAKAGLTLSLGPSQDAGTQGAVPAPGGVCIFFSPEPGLITYSYRRGRLVPVPVSQPQQQPNEAPGKWRWELEPLTAEQQAMMTTTMGMAMLILLLILFAPVGA